MAADPRLEPSGACPFDRLSDEVLCEVLKRVAAYDGGHLVHLKDFKETWVDGCRLLRLTTVCERFKKLARGVAAHVTWQFARHVDTMGVAAVLQAGLHTKGLALFHHAHQAPVIDDQMIPRHVSLDYLAALFGRTPNLDTLVFMGSGGPQHEAASALFYKLLSQLPLKCLSLHLCDFSSTQRLSKTQHFPHLKQCTIGDTQISDQFLSSLLKQTPKIETLSLKQSHGLVQPNFSSPSLRKLVLDLKEWEGGRLSIDLPKLTRLESLPLCERLTINAPALERLSLVGPMQSIECPGGRSEVAHLEVMWGSYWQLADVARVISTFRGSTSISIMLDVSWHSESQPEPLSSFLQRLPRSIRYLNLGGAMPQLFEGDNCKTQLGGVSFEQLTHVDLAILQEKDFIIVPLVLRCCPKLQKVTLDFSEVTTPLAGLLTRVVKLQKEFPHAEMEFEEPALFISSHHLEDTLEGPSDQYEELIQNIRNINAGL